MGSFSSFLEHSYQTPYFFCQFGSKKLTFVSLAKAPLYQTPYFNFTILFLIYSYYFIYFFTTFKIPTFLIFFYPSFIHP
jgi:hypothetical protein